MNERVVSIAGLNKLDQLDLEGTPGVRFEEIEVPPGAQGELTLLTAYFAMTALTALAAYLLRKHEGEAFEEDVTITHPDGRIEVRRIRYKADRSAPPEADILRQLRGPI